MEKMKKYNLNYSLKFGLFSLLLLLFFTACKENELLKYDDDAALYFAKDSVSQSFFLISSDMLRDTLYIQVNTMGHLSDVNRPIPIAQTNTGESNAAVAGVHYLPFDDPEVRDLMVVPAGKAIGHIPVILLRDKSLDLKTVSLKMRIGENEYFRPGIDTQREFLVKTTAQATKPNVWDTRWRYYFGLSWGSAKMRFLIDVTGYTDWENASIDGAYIRYMSALVQQKLLEYNEAHPDAPLSEADGTIVTFDK